MLYDEETSGHDAQLEEVLIDVISQTVTLRMAAYPDPQASDRILISVMFENVEAVQTIANLAELAVHQAAGHLAYWKVAKGAGTSFFYLAAGCLSVTARTAPVLKKL
jgi:hypothetical protein